jgi:hypothetical protein
MFSRERRGSGQGRPLLDVKPRRAASRATLNVESLEGRTLLSYLVAVKHGKTIPVYTGDARDDQPLFSNGIGVKHALHFYPLYTGPKLPQLNGISATAVIAGNLVRGANLILTGTVAGPILQKPKTPAQEAIYSFAIDRGGASEDGPFPNRPLIRFDTQVVAAVRQNGVKGYVLTTDPLTNQPNTPARPLSSSSVQIRGNVVTITVPLSMLPSSGKAINQWNVNFFTRNPDQFSNFHNVASFTPEFTMFQVRVDEPHVPNVI